MSATLYLAWDNSYWIVWDEVTNDYGLGDTPDEARMDYLESLATYYDIMTAPDVSAWQRELNLKEWTPFLIDVYSGQYVIVKRHETNEGIESHYIDAMQLHAWRDHTQRNGQ